MREINQGSRKLWIDVKKKALLFSIYNFKGNLVLVKTKNGIEYLGILIEIDKNLNVFLKRVDLSLSKKKINPKIFTYFKEIILNGNKINMILPVNKKLYKFF